MTTMKNTSMALFGVALVALSANTLRAEEKGDEHPWTVSLELGKLDTEGDSYINDAYLGTLLLDYTLSPLFSIEGSLTLVPRLTGNSFTDYSSGSPEHVNRLEAATGASDTWAAGAAVDILYHVSPWKRVDPYLSLGYGVLRYGEAIGENDYFDTTPRAGAGLIYHLSDSVAVRADYRYFLSGAWNKSVSNSKLEVGLAWTIGANRPMALPKTTIIPVTEPPVTPPAGGETTKPVVVPVLPDADQDGLSDIDETTKHHTDPNNPDSDWDGLKDGAEVSQHGTNPLNRDSDGGGVSDGHEILIDKTTPTNKADDREMYELHIEFAENSAKLTAQYFEHLDVIGVILKDSPDVKVRIEGHCDQLASSSDRQAKGLTQKRADAIRDYLSSGKWKIAKKRMEAVGYGFSMPKEKPDLTNGNPGNRRIEIYINRPASKQ